MALGGIQRCMALYGRSVVSGLQMWDAGDRCCDLTGFARV